MNTYFIYTETGRVISYLTCSEVEAEMTCDAGQSYIEVAPDTPLEHYVESGEIKPYGELDLVLEQSAQGDNYRIKFTNIPMNTEVFWPDTEITVETDGELICDTPFPGTYVFRFNSPKHHTKEVIVDVAPRP